jgi:SpoVK/Ycf46/Vps4 family AAA+-type ATPase
LLPSDVVIHQSGSTMVGQYVGSTQAKVTELFKSALGGVLFIDEAGGLIPESAGTGTNAFSKEAVDTMQQLLKTEEYKCKLVVIVAGADAEIDRLFKSNMQFRSQFAKRLAFPAWTPAMALTVARNKLKAERRELEPAAADELRRGIEYLAAQPDWVSGRTIDALLSLLDKKLYHRRALERKAAKAEALARANSGAAAAPAPLSTTGSVNAPNLHQYVCSPASRQTEQLSV